MESVPEERFQKMGQTRTVRVSCFQVHEPLPIPFEEPRMASLDQGKDDHHNNVNQADESEQWPEVGTVRGVLQDHREGSAIERDRHNNVQRKSFESLRG